MLKLPSEKIHVPYIQAHKRTHTLTMKLVKSIGSFINNKTHFYMILFRVIYIRKYFCLNKWDSDVYNRWPIQIYLLTETE